MTHIYCFCFFLFTQSELHTFWKFSVKIMKQSSTCVCVYLFRTKDSSDRDGLHPEHLAKRPCTISPSQRFSPSTGLPAHPPPNGLPTHPPNGLPHPPNPQVGPQHYRLEDMALAHQYRDAFRHSEHRDSRDRHRQTGRTFTWLHRVSDSHLGG